MNMAAIYSSWIEYKEIRRKYKKLKVISIFLLIMEFINLQFMMFTGRSRG